LIDTRSTSQAPPLRTVRAVPLHCWVRSVWTEVVLSATVAALEPLSLVTSARWKTIERTELIWFWNAA
jgi:hypothetical protein